MSEGRVLTKRWKRKVGKVYTSKWQVESRDEIIGLLVADIQKKTT